MVLPPTAYPLSSGPFPVLDLILTTAVALFVTIDPVGLGPMFVGLTAGMDQRYRRRMAIKGTVIAALILFFFAFAGDLLLRALGIGFAAFRIAGGVLLMLVAIDMVFARESGVRTATADEREEARHRADISVFPLAIPLISGPGTMTTIVLFMGRAHGDLAKQAVVLGVLAGILALTLFVLIFATKVSRILGRTGITVLNRVLGILLSALACQFVIDGILASGLIPGKG
ncbi:MarC family protein [Nitrospirillum viridazoti]|uniref:UPF0056 membrane protein n=1 Tax=Nitrospirillum amazonense TaxID=28077 RepID=A0A560HXG5_9PROT|nr:MarC family protein [Nitrospirillum amazonense]TWB49600.1 multiple antibiotic resistance protein [Nitrospirillum amazonense]